jgi:hypothetical protein
MEAPVPAPDDVAAYVAAAAAMLGLQLSPGSAETVAANMTVLMERAGEFADIPLEAAADPAALLRL